MYSDTSEDDEESDFDDTGIISEIPGDSCLSSNGNMLTYSDSFVNPTGAPQTSDLNE
jgi:hypothetical protein